MSALMLAIGAGAVIGLALGALGGGGGMLAVPALIYLLGLDPTSAATASLLIVSATSLTALARHAGSVDWRTGVTFAAAGVVPAIAAAGLAQFIPRGILTGAFAMIAAAAGIAMLRSTQLDETGPTGALKVAQRVGVSKALTAGAGLGTVTGLLGVGGGFLAVPTLVTVLKLRMHVAVGTSLFVIAVNSGAALATRLATAQITLDWKVLGPFAGAALLGAWDGKRLSAKVSAAGLKRIFACLLFGLAAFMFVDAVVRGG
ncbi:sulfite exporter TauE/SafE family protein [Actinokineospora sp. HUAS TT18]|uniref:sulfite exporter TauE/SafE family protein n=1 Tax=Actinokineospora sp. HUAS TT18 TaxID=3447451 RepID=UPI003F51E8D8